MPEYFIQIQISGILLHHQVHTKIMKPRMFLKPTINTIGSQQSFLFRLNTCLQSLLILQKAHSNMHWETHETQHVSKTCDSSKPSFPSFVYLL